MKLKFVTVLLKKLGINSSTVTSEDLEDIGLSKLMPKANKSKKVSRLEIMKKLSDY